MAKITYEKSKIYYQEESEKNEQNYKESLSFLEAGANCVKQLRNLMSEIIDHSNRYWIGKSASLKQMLQLNRLRDKIAQIDDELTLAYFMDEMRYLQSPR